MSDSKESDYNTGDLGSVPGSGKSPGEGNGNPLQYSCLENPTDRGAQRATVHRITKNQTKTEQPTLICIKKNKIGSFVEMWMDLETVIQSEVSQKKRNKYCVLMHNVQNLEKWYR